MFRVVTDYVKGIGPMGYTVAVCDDCGRTTEPYLDVNEWAMGIADARATGAGWQRRLNGRVNQHVCASCLDIETGGQMGLPFTRTA